MKSRSSGLRSSYIYQWSIVILNTGTVHKNREWSQKVWWHDTHLVHVTFFFWHLFSSQILLVDKGNNNRRNYYSVFFNQVVSLPVLTSRLAGMRSLMYVLSCLVLLIEWLTTMMSQHKLHHTGAYLTQVSVIWKFVVNTIDWFKIKSLRWHILFAK